MVLENRVKQIGNKLLFQQFICNDFKFVDGWIEFDIKKGKWETFFEMEKVESGDAYQCYQALIMPKSKGVRTGIE